MKKLGIIFVSLVILLSSVLLVGCKNKDDGFEIVSSISFVSGGKSQVVQSTYLWKSSETISIDRAEFHSNASFSNIINRPEWTPLKKNIELSKSYYDKNKYYYWLTTIYRTDGTILLQEYYKSKFAGYQYRYIYVKVIDNETIQIKQNDKITTYKVTSYSITYFEN